MIKRFFLSLGVLAFVAFSASADEAWDTFKNPKLGIEFEKPKCLVVGDDIGGPIEDSQILSFWSRGKCEEVELNKFAFYFQLPLDIPLYKRERVLKNPDALVTREIKAGGKSGVLSVYKLQNEGVKYLRWQFWLPCRSANFKLVTSEKVTSADYEQVRLKKRTAPAFFLRTIKSVKCNENKSDH